MILVADSGGRAWWWLSGLAMLLALLIWPGAASSGAGEVFEARVVKVVDGDSLEVLRGREAIRIRLEGIDCPERGQPWSQRAKQFTSKSTFDRVVQVRVKTRDRYGRLVARVIAEGRDVSPALLEAGLAWHYKQYNQEPELARLEAEARAARRGLWSDPDPIPPWEWRRGRRS